MTSKVELYRIATEYFEAWNSQSSKKLFNLFNEDVKLVDWNIEVRGIDAVLKANEDIWRNVPDINAMVIDIGTSQTHRAYCHIMIKSKTANLNFSVIDVLSIRDNKIYRVDAYHNKD